FAGFCGCLKEKSKISNDESKFYGTWVGNATASLWGTYNVSYTFNKNGTYTSTSDFTELETGEWEIKNNKLYVPVGLEPGLGYEFSNEDTRLTISLLGDPYMVLDKIESV
ncbi:MAG: hypothetical protein DRO67_09790, partial [Candidatus Asgardarchaeum californiense]